MASSHARLDTNSTPRNSEKLVDLISTSSYKVPKEKSKQEKTDRPENEKTGSNETLGDPLSLMRSLFESITDTNKRLLEEYRQLKQGLSDHREDLPRDSQNEDGITMQPQVRRR